MYKTDYKIKKDGSTYSAFKGEKLQCKCMDEESTLHAIWVLEGKVHDDFYVIHDGIVSIVDRGEL